MTGDKKYAEMAEKALISFQIPVNEGDVTSFTEFGPFYEEYTSDVAVLVLNGMIFSLCRLYVFVRVFPENKLAQKLFNDGIETLKNILPEFDLGFWSRYNLCRASWYPLIDPATVTYQHLHVVQFRMLFKLTGVKLFQLYRLKFQDQIKFFNIIKMYF